MAAGDSPKHARPRPKKAVARTPPARQGLAGAEPRYEEVALGARGWVFRYPPQYLLLFLIL